MPGTHGSGGTLPLTRNENQALDKMQRLIPDGFFNELSENLVDILIKIFFNNVCTSDLTICNAPSFFPEFTDNPLDRSFTDTKPKCHFSRSPGTLQISKPENSHFQIFPISSGHNSITCTRHCYIS